MRSSAPSAPATGSARPASDAMDPARSAIAAQVSQLFETEARTASLSTVS